MNVTSRTTFIFVVIVLWVEIAQGWTLHRSPMQLKLQAQTHEGHVTGQSSPLRLLLQKPFVLVPLTLSAFLLPVVTFAQMPTMDDYNTGSGTIVSNVKRGSSNIQIKPAITLSSFPAEAQIKDLPSYLQHGVDVLKQLVQEERWEDILSCCKALDNMCVDHCLPSLPF